MRLLIDVHGMDSNAAWGVTTKALAYTNHTCVLDKGQPGRRQLGLACTEQRGARQRGGAGGAPRTSGGLPWAPGPVVCTLVPETVCPAASPKALEKRPCICNLPRLCPPLFALH